MSTLHVVPPARLRDLVAAEVRAEMGRQQVTQVQLSRAIGMSQQSLSERLRGKTPFTTDDLDTIADALGVHPAVLLGGRANTPSPSGGSTLRSHGVRNTESDDFSGLARIWSPGCSGELQSGGIAA